MKKYTLFSYRYISMARSLTAVLTVSVIMIQDGRVLLLREQKNGGSIYNLPGGHVDTGESVMTAAIREAEEETGFLIQLGSLVQIFNRAWEDGHHSVRQTYTADIMGGALKTEEGSEAFWMSREEVEVISEEQWNIGTKQAVLLGLDGHTVNPRHVAWKE